MYCIFPDINPAVTTKRRAASNFLKVQNFLASFESYMSLNLMVLQLPGAPSELRLRPCKRAETFAPFRRVSASSRFSSMESV